MWNGSEYKDIYRDPMEDKGNTRSAQASRQTRQRKFRRCSAPFDSTYSGANSRDQPSGIRCSRCGRDFSFPFSFGPW